ncbi:hypothetical protein CJP74_00095 [Psittacicella melopsittaci]|uniref:Uncharacterized protein n=1 Tax=Psittacicella melopsittaci TaxID=2028576 RepID=A0A3A1Y7G5_9GAMM|nr:hypothetical protein [Psittacicella melopsittaci]RIY34223.1 hypothetical protein CJP74_00095 [Psittacicella melopsittaci]
MTAKTKTAPIMVQEVNSDDLTSVRNYNRRPKLMHKRIKERERMIRKHNQSIDRTHFPAVEIDLDSDNFYKQYGDLFVSAKHGSQLVINFTAHIPDKNGIINTRQLKYQLGTPMVVREGGHLRYRCLVTEHYSLLSRRAKTQYSGYTLEESRQVIDSNSVYPYLSADRRELIDELERRKFYARCRYLVECAKIDLKDRGISSGEIQRIVKALKEGYAFAYEDLNPENFR